MSTFADRTELNNADVARKALEALRWPNGVLCPHCSAASSQTIAVDGVSHREGLYSCRACRGQFTVTVGTIFHRSRLPLDKWWSAVFALNDYHTEVSIEDIRAVLGVSYKTAHRMVTAMLDVWTAYKGPKRIFGAAVCKHIKVLKTKPGTRREREGTPRPHGANSLHGGVVSKPRLELYCSEIPSQESRAETQRQGQVKENINDRRSPLRVGDYGTGLSACERSIKPARAP